MALNELKFYQEAIDVYSYAIGIEPNFHQAFTTGEILSLL